MATGSFSTQDDQRVVLLGKIGPGKSSLANRILGHEIFKTEEIGLCRRKQGEHAGRKLTVVDTPGWDRVSVLRTPGMIKQEIIRSATLCLPGPHALLLVLPISMDDQPPSANEIESASHHVALLSNRAWKHTIVLFVCKDEMEKSAIDQQVQGAKKLIDKCEGRYFILQNDSDVTALLQKIEDMVEENHGDFLIPQVYYEESKKRMPSGTAGQIEMYEKRVVELKQQHRRISEKIDLDLGEKHKKLQLQVMNKYKRKRSVKRRRSIDFLPPNMAETTSQGGAAVQQLLIELFVIVMMAFFGALGAILGATAGVKGLAVGVLYGSTIGVLLAILYHINKTREEELKQLYISESEKMELDIIEELEKLDQEIIAYKTGGRMRRSDSKEFLPPNMAETSQGGAAVQDQDSEQEINICTTGGTMRRRRSIEFLPPHMAETSQGGAAVQHQDSVKKTGAENEKRMPHGIAEQTEMYEKREEELTQLKTELEKMKLDVREQLGKLKQEINGRGQQWGTMNIFAIVMMAFFGILVGAIVGVTDGVESAVGVIIGSTIGVLLAVLYIRATRFG